MKNTYCEKLMWLIMNGVITKFVSAEMPDCDIKRFKRIFKSRYVALRNEIDDIGVLTKNPLRICLTGGMIWIAALKQRKEK